MPVPIVPIVTETTPAAPLTWFTLGALLVVLMLLVRGRNRLGGTTLIAPCLWAAFSVLCLAGAVCIESFQGIEQGAYGQSALWFAAVATTFCPMMAVLGAKRPQDVGWQWVVASLWLVLVWPVGQTVLMRIATVELFPAWKLFLAGLIVLGPLNYLPTRFWLASLLVAAGQLALLSGYLWSISRDESVWLLSAGTSCFLVAAGIVAWQCRIKVSTVEEVDKLALYSQRWQKFRDTYGAFWALRILGRVNQTAELSEWPMRLTWAGFEYSADAEPTAGQFNELEQAMTTLLRRFT